MGILRVLDGLVLAIGMTGAWMLLACVVAVVTLYIARFIPMTGRHRPRPRTRG